MKVVLLAGGMGSRISEESEYRPKPMVEIGGMPIIWHIMKEYSYYGFNEFVICGGYKQYMIKKWFADYSFYVADMTFDMGDCNHIIIHDYHTEPWKVTVVDTGEKTMTGGRIKRVEKYVGASTFMMTYGDGVCDVDIGKLLEFHRSHGKTATITAVVQKQEKGILDVNIDNSVRAFREKRNEDNRRINAGYMVFEPDVFKLLKGDQTVLETEVLTRLAGQGELMSYSHDGFWQCMDTLLEKRRLEALIQSGNAPWIRW